MIKKFVLFIICLLFIPYIAAAQGLYPDVASGLKKKDCLTTRILSIDGGGVRGVIAARILQEFEKRANKPISELFDLAAGTSTGGLIILALATPIDGKNVPLYSAEDIMNIYLFHSKDIFVKSFFRELYTGFGMWGAKYDRTYYDNELEKIFKNNLLSNALYASYIPIYSLTEKKPFVAERDMARESSDCNFYLKDIAAATSAAPTYFAPKVFNNLSNTKVYTAADGGIYANDPEILAGIGLIKHCPDFNINQVIFVSIGTGEVESKVEKKEGNSGIIDWIKDKNLVNSMIDAETDIDEMVLSTVFKHNKYRLQIQIPLQLAALDDTDPKNIKALLDITENYLKNNDKMVEEIVSKLMEKSN